MDGNLVGLTDRAKRGKPARVNSWGEPNIYQPELSLDAEGSVPLDDGRSFSLLEQRVTVFIGPVPECNQDLAQNFTLSAVVRGRKEWPDRVPNFHLKYG